MRVLLAHNRYRYPGGEERHVETLAESLAAAGVDVGRFERDSAPTSSSGWLRVNAALGAAYRPSAGRALAAELAERPCDVVHFHNIMPLLTPAAVRAAKRSGARVVLTTHNYRFACPGGTLYHDGETHEDCVEGSPLTCAVRRPGPSRVQTLVYGVALELQRRLRLLDRWVDAYVAPSRFVARMLVRTGVGPERVHVVPHGVSAEAADVTPPDFALYAGRLSEEKGVATLLRAARLTDVPLVIAGDGPLADVVRAQTSAATVYVGPLPSAALAELRRRAAFVVVPSECHEVFPLAVLEGLAAGKPVLATRMGGIPEAVEDGVTGVLVPPRSPDALAEAMRNLWRDAARARRLGRNARRLALSKFSVDGQIARLLQVYEVAAA